MAWSRTAQQDRHYRRVTANRKSCSFEDLKRLLESYGYVERPRHGRSPHRVFKRAGSNPIPVPFARPVREHYVDAVLEAIDILETFWRTSETSP